MPGMQLATRNPNSPRPAKVTGTLLVGAMLLTFSDARPERTEESMRELGGKQQELGFGAARIRAPWIHEARGGPVEDAADPPRGRWEQQPHGGGGLGLRSGCARSSKACSIWGQGKGREGSDGEGRGRWAAAEEKRAEIAGGGHHRWDGGERGRRLSGLEWNEKEREEGIGTATERRWPRWRGGRGCGGGGGGGGVAAARAAGWI